MRKGYTYKKLSLLPIKISEEPLCYPALYPFIPAIRGSDRFLFFPFCLLASALPLCKHDRTERNARDIAESPADSADFPGVRLEQDYDHRYALLPKGNAKPSTNRLAMLAQDFIDLRGHSAVAHNNVDYSDTLPVRAHR